MKLSHGTSVVSAADCPTPRQVSGHSQDQKNHLGDTHLLSDMRQCLLFIAYTSKLLCLFVWQWCCKGQLAN